MKTKPFITAIVAVTIFAAVIASQPTLAAGEKRPAANPNPMPVGVDDAGAKRPIFQDLQMAAAFENIGFDFLMYHVECNERHHAGDKSTEIEDLVNWASQTGHDFILNQENASRPEGAPTIYRKPGLFYQPSKEFLARAAKGGHLLGVCYDEAEHWVNQGVWITGAKKPFAPHFHDAEGETLDQAYEGNLFNLQTLMRQNYAGFATPANGRKNPIVCTEHVFPAMFHVFARAGISPMPKYMKETVTPVTAAMALGCVRQYGTQYWPCLDLWGPTPPPLTFPNHKPAELYSALLFAYWTGAQRTYVENINYKDSLYRVVDGRVQLTAWGEAVRQFRRDYLPAHPRAIRVEEFAPEIVIVRFPDTDWGQIKTGCTRLSLYGASNLVPDEQTRYWIRIWHVISHGTIPKEGLNWNAWNTALRKKMPFRLFFPANNVVVYDHLAADPKLFAAAKLVFLTGKEISPACLKTLTTLVKQGLTVVTPSHLSPSGLTLATGEVAKEFPAGRGRWIVTDQVDNKDVAPLLQPYLGSSDQMRFVFGKTEVIFRAGDDGGLQLEQRPLAK